MRRGLLLEWRLVGELCMCRGSGDERRVSRQGQGRCRRKLLGLAGDNVRTKNYYKLMSVLGVPLLLFGPVRGHLAQASQWQPK